MGEESAAPPVSSQFLHVADRYGTRLALVFGNHNREGLCPYFVAGRCHHCDIGAGEGRALDLTTNRERLQWFQKQYSRVLPEVAHLVVYNSGNVLNPREMPAQLLAEILSWAGQLPRMRLLSLDSRESYITRERLVTLGSRLPAGIGLRPILGLETADDRIRNQLLQKAMPRQAIHRALVSLGQARRDLAGRVDIGLDVNVVVGGPGTTSRTAVTDAVTTVSTVLRWAEEFDFPVDFNIHAYHPTVRGRACFPAHNRCSLEVVVAVVESLCGVVSAPTALFIGWQDEGHDLEQETRRTELSTAGAAFDDFNRTQDPGHLSALFGGGR